MAPAKQKNFGIVLQHHSDGTSNCIPTTPTFIMSSLRIARAALRARPAAIARPVMRRGYADVASDKIKLSLALPHQVRISWCGAH